MGVASAKGVIIINGRAYDAQKVVDALLNSTYIDVKVEGTSLIIAGNRIQPISRSVQELAMLRTCFGSLAYCCSPEKKCVDRDGALELLGLTTDDYTKIKSSCHQAFIDFSKGITDTSAFKTQELSYEGSVEGDMPRQSEIVSSEGDTARYYRGGSKVYSTTEESPSSSSTNGKSYGPIDLSLIFGEPSIRSSSPSLANDSRRDRVSRSWSRSAGVSPTLDSESDASNEAEEEPVTRCIHCRARLAAGARYCHNCGKSVG